MGIHSHVTLYLNRHILSLVSPTKNSLSCLANHSLKRRRDSDESYTNGGAPIPVGSRKIIVQMHFTCGMVPEEIAPLIPSPRSDDALSVDAVK